MNEADLGPDLSMPTTMTATGPRTRPRSRSLASLPSANGATDLGVVQGVGGMSHPPHEHPRGTGYHRGLFDEQITAPMRVLMVCDAIAAMGERRAHRPALGREAILAEVGREIDTGRYRRDVVEAALDAAGLESARPKARERPLPAGLSEREVEVLCWVARGKTNKEIGKILAISARTVQHHVAHIYDKIGAYSRAGAAIFAMEHRLLEG